MRTTLSMAMILMMLAWCLPARAAFVNNMEDFNDGTHGEDPPSNSEFTSTWDLYNYGGNCDCYHVEDLGLDGTMAMRTYNFSGSPGSGYVDITTKLAQDTVSIGKTVSVYATPHDYLGNYATLGLFLTPRALRGSGRVFDEDVQIGLLWDYHNTEIRARAKSAGGSEIDTVVYDGGNPLDTYYKYELELATSSTFNARVFEYGEEGDTLLGEVTDIAMPEGYSGDWYVSLTTLQLGFAHWDNVAIIPVPEPASIILLVGAAAALLGLARKHRRG